MLAWILWIALLCVCVKSVVWDADCVTDANSAMYSLEYEISTTGCACKTTVDAITQSVVNGSIILNFTGPVITTFDCGSTTSTCDLDSSGNPYTPVLSVVLYPNGLTGITLVSPTDFGVSFGIFALEFAAPYGTPTHCTVPGSNTLGGLCETRYIKTYGLDLYYTMTTGLCKFDCNNVTTYNTVVNGGCAPHGTCVATDQCLCSSGYSGAACDTWNCSGISHSNQSVCSGNGDCVSPQNCSCSPGYSGSNCEEWSCGGIPKSSNLTCSSHGVCVSSNVCSCDFGYVGATCQPIGPVVWNQYCVTNSSAARYVVEYTTVANSCNCMSALEATDQFVTTSGVLMMVFTDPVTDVVGNNCEFLGAYSCVYDAYGQEYTNIQINAFVRVDGLSGISVWNPISLISEFTTPRLYLESAVSPLTPTSCTVQGSNAMGGLCDVRTTHGDMTDTITTGLCKMTCNGVSTYNTIENSGCNFPNGVCVGLDQCNCAAGYSGAACDTWNCSGISHSDQSVCSGHGNCASPQNCLCSPGYNGSNCEMWSCGGILKTSNLTCSSHGVCVSPNVCSCDVGYGGSTCQPICYGKLQNDTTVCTSHGACVNPTQCQCATGYFGIQCELWNCSGVGYNHSTVCSGHGVCVSPENCSCSSGYSGSNCESWSCGGIPESSNSVCSSHGLCASPNSCQCEQGYTTSQCNTWSCNGISNQLTTVCNGRGNCTDVDSCTCLTGFSGDDCEDWYCNNQHKSSSAVCGGRGICTAPDFCVCGVPYVGNLCQDDGSSISTALIILGVLAGVCGLVVIAAIISCVISALGGQARPDVLHQFKQIPDTDSLVPW